MGFIRKTLGFLGLGAQGEIFDKTLGRPLRDDRLKAAVSETVGKVLWACIVLGDRCFPGLRGKRLLRVHLGGLIVLIAVSIIPGFLIVRAGRKLMDFEWVNIRREQAKQHHQRQHATENSINTNQGGSGHEPSGATTTTSKEARQTEESRKE
jgi:hypothetical protein